MVHILPVLCSCSKHCSRLIIQNGNLKAFFSVIWAVWYLAQSSFYLLLLLDRCFTLETCVCVLTKPLSLFAFSLYTLILSEQSPQCSSRNTDASIDAIVFIVKQKQSVSAVSPVNGGWKYGLYTVCERGDPISILLAGKKRFLLSSRLLGGQRMQHRLPEM